MNMNKKMRYAALTAMITLALSGSAMAMPSGGSVTQGSVSVNGAAATTINSVTSGATIAANTNSIIDWQAFGIEAGQKLNFDTANGALLNRVVGNDMSKLMGTLTQTGNNALMLVNPNGILVGGNAVIDASQLVLSTLALSNQDFLAFADGGIANFTTEKAGAGITVEKGAAIDIDQVLLMAGGTVNVADGVTFSTDSNNSAMVEIAGAQSLKVDTTKSLQDSMSNIATTKDNAESFHGTFDNTSSNGNTNFHVDGGTVNLDNAKIKLNNNSEAYLVAGNKAANSATTDNIISGKNVTVQGSKETVILGGKVTLENAAVSSNGKISVAAGSQFGREGNNNIRTVKASAANEIVLKDSTLQNNKKEIQVTGGKITVDGTTIQSNDTVGVKAYKSSEAMDKKSLNGAFDNGQKVTIKNGSKVQAADTVVVLGYDVEQSASSTVKSNKDLAIVNHNYQGSNITPTQIADGATTGYAVAPEASKSTNNTPSNNTPSTKPSDVKPVNPINLSEDDKANKAEGEKAVQNILASESTVADRQLAVNEYVSNLNRAAGNDRAKAAQVFGMLKKFEEMKSAEGNILMLTVLNAYEPVKAAKDVADKAKIAEGAAVENHTVNTQALQNATGPNESANEVPVDASEVTA